MYAWLVAYHFLFFWKFYSNPYLLSTSELATTYFPFFRNLKWIDNIYYRYPACIPFLSTFYPPNVILSLLTRSLPLNIGFRVYAYFILAHYLLGSFLAYFMFRQWAGELASLFGAITLTYSGYSIKLQTPSFVYTASWLPGMFLSGGFGALCTATAILGGYWPILVYVWPIALILRPNTAILGALFALPQIIPFLWYYRKSVRWKEKVDRNFGRVPWWKLKDLIIPSNNYNQTNGVHYPEMEMYMGIAPFFIFHWSLWWFLLAIGLMVVSGVLPAVQRIPARALLLVTLSIVFLSSKSSSLTLLLVFLQAFLLLRNVSIYPSFPFSQWWDRPSRIYPRADYTGYLNGKRIHNYSGAFSLRA